MSDNVDINNKLEGIEKKLSELSHEINTVKFKEEL